MAEKDLANYRKNYSKSSLDESQLEASPFELFKIWFEEADNDAKIEEANAMSLSTVGKDMKPRTRVVLLKEFNTQGFVFFTNYRSKKGQALAENPFACISFFWASQERQVIIEGKVEKISAKDSDTYFNSRPLGSRLGALASPQSEVISDRAFLENELKKVQNQFKSELPKRPVHWGGYLLVPEHFEFWQGRENRLHDRIRYGYENKSWSSVRLAP